MKSAKGTFKTPTNTKLLFEADDVTTIAGEDVESKDLITKINNLDWESQSLTKKPEKQMEKQKQEIEEMETLRQLVEKRVLAKKAKQDSLQRIQQKLKQTYKERVKVAYKRIRALRKQKKDAEVRKIVDDVIQNLPEVNSDDSSDEEYERAKEVIELVADKEKKRDVEDAAIFFENSPTATTSSKKAKVLEEVVPPPPPLPQKTVAVIKDPFVASLHEELTDIVKRATIPLVNFASMVGVKLRVDYASRLLASKEERERLIEPAETIEDFFEKNRDLGVNLLTLFMNGIEDGLIQQGEENGLAQMGGEIHPCFDLDDLEDVTSRAEDNTLLAKVERLKMQITQLQANGIDATEQIKQFNTVNNQLSIQNARKKLIGGDLEHRFAPAWAFEVMGSAIFRKVLAGTSLAAFEAACSEVRRIPNCHNFTLKELICSPEVNDKFAYLVASSWLSSGDDTAQPIGGAGGKGKGGGHRNRHYLNVMKMRQELHDEIDMCKIFFEVSVRRGKSRVKRAFEEAFEKRKPDKKTTLSYSDYDAWEKRMKVYIDQMPEYELFYIK